MPCPSGRFITFVSSIYMLEYGTSVGWRITPHGAPAMSEGKLTIAAWIEVSETAMANVRRATASQCRSCRFTGQGMPKPVCTPPPHRQARVSGHWPDAGNTRPGYQR